jgi:SAM-dependent methyltransferase
MGTPFAGEHVDAEAEVRYPGWAMLDYFGRIDIYLFDQLLRGRITPGMRVLDAGCGGGRNAEFLLRAGCDIHGVDASPEAVARVREMASTIISAEEAGARFQLRRLQDLPYPDGHFGAVICNAVLHFSEDPEDFRAILAELWRVLAPGGVFFSRLASTIGMEDRVSPLRGRWYRLPDGTDRFLVDAGFLAEMARELGAVHLDPLKTTVVEDMRSMTTWVLGKREEGR